MTALRHPANPAISKDPERLEPFGACNLFEPAPGAARRGRDQAPLSSQKSPWAASGRGAS
jgi:hypothetical protein